MILTVKSNLDAFKIPAKITFSIGEIDAYLNKKLPNRRISLLTGKEYTWKASINKKWHLHPKSGNIKIGKTHKTITLTVIGGNTKVFALGNSSVEDADWTVTDVHCGPSPAGVFIQLASLPVGWDHYSFSVAGGSCSWEDLPRTTAAPTFVALDVGCDFIYDGVTTYTVTLTVYDSGGYPINITSNIVGPCN